MPADWGQDPIVVGLREEISRADRELLKTLNRRIALVGRLRDYKAERGYPFVDQAREERIIADLDNANAGPLSSEGLREFFTRTLELVKRELDRDGAGP
jgi:chorismate mutase